MLVGQKQIDCVNTTHAQKSRVWSEEEGLGSHYRSSSISHHIKERQVSIIIQRYYRGHLGRVRFQKIRLEKEKEERQRFFDSQALIIQKR